MKPEPCIQSKNVQEDQQNARWEVEFCVEQNMLMKLKSCRIWIQRQFECSKSVTLQKVFLKKLFRIRRAILNFSELQALVLSKIVLKVYIWSGKIVQIL